MLKTTMYIFTGVMILVYLAAGVFVLLMPQESGFFKDYPSYIKTLLGGTIILYGLYRLYNLIQKIKKDKENEE